MSERPVHLQHLIDCASTAVEAIDRGDYDPASLAARDSD